MKEAPRENPFFNALSARQQAEIERRSQVAANVASLIEFLNTDEGVKWIFDQTKKQMRKSRSYNLQEQWNSFSCGHTTGIVIYPNSELSCLIPSFIDHDLRIILTGKSGIVSDVYLAERVEGYLPTIIKEDGGNLSYEDLENEKYKAKAVAQAMDQAAKDHPRIKADLPRYRCIIDMTQGENCKCPYVCFVAKTYSPEQLVDELGVGVAERLCSGFEKAIKEK